MNGAGRKLERTLKQVNSDFAIINSFGEETLTHLLLALRAGDMAKARNVYDNIAYRTADAVAAPVEQPTWEQQPKTLPVITPADSSADDSACCSSKPQEAYLGKSYRMNPIASEDLIPGKPMIDVHNIGRQLLGDTVHVRTCSSCPFKCKFCTFPVLQGDHILFELDDVMFQLRQFQEIGVKYLFFIDDTFNVPKKRFEELMDLMMRPISACSG